GARPPVVLLAAPRQRRARGSAATSTAGRAGRFRGSVRETMNDVSPVPAGSAAGADGDVLLRVENLVKYFPVKSGGVFRPREYVHAVDDVSFTVRRGQTFGIVGETGCGESTLGPLLAPLYDESRS